MRTEQTIINVIFDAGRGTLSEESREAVQGAPIGALPQPVRRGYRFAGWYQGETLVTEDTVIEGEEDLRLSARWEKEQGTQKSSSSSFKRQKRALVILAAVAVILLIVWIVVSQLIAIYTLKDTYIKDGVTYTDTYIIKREDGIYKLFDDEGNRMPTNGIDEDVFIADRGSKNHYRIDPQTGEYKLRAVIDAEGVEAVQGTTLLLYPQISSSNLYSLKVTHHENGTSYKFLHTTAGTYLEGYKDSLVQYEEKLFATLCIAAGWTSSNRKLTAASDVAKLPDGSINYAVYGLDQPTATFEIQAALYKKDANGNTLYKDNAPVFDYEEGVDEDGNATKEYRPDPDQKYTVHIGDATPSGGGYYVQLEGNPAIYILSANYISQTILQPVEALVVPRAVHPVSVNMHSSVQEFRLTYLDAWSTESVKDGKLIVGLNFDVLDSRQNTMNVTNPYRNIGHALMEGYEINANSAATALSNLYNMQYIACKKLGINGNMDVLKEYGLDKDIYYLSYGVDLNEKDGKDIYTENKIIIGQKNENGNYYVASLTYDMIVEVAPTYLSFVEWEDVQWYQKSFLSTSISYLEELYFQFGDKSYDFSFDNSLSYSFYLTAAIDDEGNTVPALAAADPAIGYLYYEGNQLKYKANNNVVYEAFTIDLRNTPVISYRDAVLDPTRKNVIYTEVGYYFINSDGETVSVTPDYKTSDIEYRNDTFWYVEYDKSGNITREIQVQREYGDAMYRYSEGLQAIIMVASGFLKVSVAEDGGESKLMDYTITESFRDDTGVEKVESVTALENFRQLFIQLLYFSLEGDVNEKDFMAQTGKNIVDFLAENPLPDATFVMQARDYASILNAFTVYDEDGNPSRLHTEDLSKNLVVRFYAYSDWKALVTLQTFEVDENGNKIYSDATIEGRFFVDNRYLAEFQEAIEQFVNQEIIAQ